MSSPLPGFVAAPLEDARLWVRAGLEEAAPLLAAAWAGRAQRWQAGGRAEHPVVPLPEGGSALVRRYRRGGAVRRVNRDLYFLGDRARTEAAVTEEARAAGVPVPEVIAYGCRPAGMGYRAMIATRLLEGVEDAAAALGRTDQRRRILLALGEALRRLHGAGIAHPDLNLRNVLVGRGSEIWLIDLDRARHHPGGVRASARAANLRRLLRSAARLGLPLQESDLAALAEGYGPGWPLPPVGRG